MFCLQVSKSVIWAYVKALGVKYTLFIFLVYGLYQGFVVWSSIWLTDWTSDEKLQVSPIIASLFHPVTHSNCNTGHIFKPYSTEHK